MHLNPREQEGSVTLGFAGLQGAAFSMAWLASAHAKLGFLFGPQRAGMGACSHHGADVLHLSLFSSSTGHGVCVYKDARCHEGLPGFGDTAEDPEGGCTHLVTTTGFADPPYSVWMDVPGQNPAVPIVHGPLRDHSAGKRLTGRRQARRWLPAPDPSLGWGAAGSCKSNAKIAI